MKVLRELFSLRFKDALSSSVVFFISMSSLRRLVFSLVYNIGFREPLQELFYSLVSESC